MISNALTFVLVKLVTAPRPDGLQASAAVYVVLDHHIIVVHTIIIERHGQRDGSPVHTRQRAIWVHLAHAVGQIKRVILEEIDTEHVSGAVEIVEPEQGVAHVGRACATATINKMPGLAPEVHHDTRLVPPNRPLRRVEHAEQRRALSPRRSCERRRAVGESGQLVAERAHPAWRGRLVVQARAHVAVHPHRLARRLGRGAALLQKCEGGGRHRRFHGPAVMCSFTENCRSQKR
eukprot:scaffold111_cov156-Isochrysis_galbana.AAC.2